MGEQFREIPGFPAYRVSSRGRLQGSRSTPNGGSPPKDQSCRSWYDLNPGRRKGGHLQAALYRDGKRHNLFVHRIVAEVFIGPCPGGMICRHLNGDPADNRAENLAWGTWHDNFDDAVRHGTMRRRVENNPDAAEMELAKKRDDVLSRLSQDESFREIDYAPGYRVSSWGRFQSCRELVHVKGGSRGETLTVLSGEWKDLNPSLWRGGYLMASFMVGGRHRKRVVHRIVLEAFLGPMPPGFLCRHLNGVKTDNRLENLAYGTHKSNAADRHEHGTSMIGDRNHAAKLTPGDVLDLRRRREQGESYARLGVAFGIAASSACSIALRQTWKHV
jgi:hypothetical protein